MLRLSPRVSSSLLYRLFFWFLALLLGLLQILPHQKDLLFTDGLSYIEIAEAYLRGNWRSAINGYWSPLYSWFLALGLGIFKPSPEKEYALVHGMNFLIYLLALLSFDLLLRQWIRYHQNQKALPSFQGGYGDSSPKLGDTPTLIPPHRKELWILLGILFFNLYWRWSSLPYWLADQVAHHWRVPLSWITTVNLALYGGLLFLFVLVFLFLTRCFTQEQKVSSARYNSLSKEHWLLLGYSLFIYFSLAFIIVRIETPDMLVTALVYLTAFLLLRIHMEERSYLSSVLLGVTLGLGYLAKSALFPVALLLLVSLLLLKNSKRYYNLRVFSLALFTFCLVAGPFITVLSLAKGRFTFGDAGPLNYARFVNGISYPPPEEVRKTLPHPLRKILSSPTIWEFSQPVAGTYPPWYDPSYWQEGIRPRWVLKDQMKALQESQRRYRIFILNNQGEILLLWVFFLVLCWKPTWKLGCWKDLWLIGFLGFFPLLMYALVIVQRRYICAFVLLLWLWLFSKIRFPQGAGVRRWTFILLLFFSGILLGRVAIPTWNNFRRGETSIAWVVAQQLHRLGLRPGDKVACLGLVNPYHFSWARMARVKIVAEILNQDVDQFWLANEATRRRVLQAFAKVGAKAVVATHIPPSASLKGWHKVAHRLTPPRTMEELSRDNDYYAYFFQSLSPFSFHLFEETWSR